MMIGVFDSGSGGLTFLQEAKKLLQDYDFVYFGDYKNCPYGNKTSDEIYQLTKIGVEKLRDNGASIVILACNTATSVAIRKLQKKEPELGVKVLGITIPGAEKVLEGGYNRITVVATNTSVKNKLYKSRVGILDSRIAVQEIGLENLAVLVEDYLENKISDEILEIYLHEKLSYVWKDTEAIVLGCTHYSHIKHIFKKLFPNKIIIDPSLEAARKLYKYLENHPEVHKSLSKNQQELYI